MPPSGDGMSAADERAITRFLDDRLVEWNVPGASVALFDADGVLFADGLGARSTDPVEPATPDSLFHVASVTKGFTAVAVLQLVERGDLALEDPVGEHVDLLADAPGEPVTVAELLTHASGIPSDVGRLDGCVADRADLRRRFDRWADGRVTDRDRLMYYNGGYVVLGALVEAVAGEPYAAFVQREVLDPLGLERSTFDQDAIETDDDAMTGYVDADGDLEAAAMDPAEFVALREELFGVGGLVSTATDLAAVGRFLLGGGALDGERLLEPASAAAMCRSQSPPWPTVEGHEMHYGYGWIVEDALGDDLVWGGGTVPGYNAFVGVLREHELGVALGFNRSDIPKEEIGKGVLALARGEDPEEAVRWYAARRAVDAVAGTYEFDRSDATVTVGPAEPDDLSSLGTVVEVNAEAWDVRFQAAPAAERCDGDGPDSYVFDARMGDGRRWELEFVEADGETVMLWAWGPRRLRFTKR